MRGIVFTEFLEMVEASYSPELLEKVIDEADLASKGVYTAVGSYDHNELLALVGVLAKNTGTSEHDLLRNFGERIFETFLTRYSRFFIEPDAAVDFLDSVENHVHGEVKKLYPDAECPNFVTERHGPGHFSLIYTSPRPLGDLCEGLLRATLRHFGEQADITRTDLETTPLTQVRFDVIRRGG